MKNAEAAISSKRGGRGGKKFEDYGGRSKHFRTEGTNLGGGVLLLGVGSVVSTPLHAMSIYVRVVNVWI